MAWYWNQTHIQIHLRVYDVIWLLFKFVRVVQSCDENTSNTHRFGMWRLFTVFMNMKSVSVVKIGWVNRHPKLVSIFSKCLLPLPFVAVMAVCFLPFVLLKMWALRLPISYFARGISVATKIIGFCRSKNIKVLITSNKYSRLGLSARSLARLLTALDYSFDYFVEIFLIWEHTKCAFCFDLFIFRCYIRFDVFVVFVCVHFKATRLTFMDSVSLRLGIRYRESMCWCWYTFKIFVLYKRHYRFVSSELKFVSRLCANSSFHRPPCIYDQNVWHDCEKRIYAGFK